MVLPALLCDHGLNRRTQCGAIAGRTGADNRKKKIASCHRASGPKKTNQ
jgi:hypothetical protein